MKRRRTDPEVAQTEVLRVERRLGDMLREVPPRQAFVSNLKNRLAKETMPRRSNTQIVQYILLSLAGIVSGAMLMIAGIRAMVTLLGLLGILHQVGQQRRRAVQPMMIDLSH
jgi:hypothetical protein